MEYCRTIELKNGKKCIIRNATEQDAKACLDVFILTHNETDYLLSVPSEINYTVEQEAKYLKEKTESKDEIELVAEVDGEIVAMGGLDKVHTYIKSRHRVDFGVSVLKEFWGLGIGRAILNACIECAEKAGYEQFELEVVADNKNAVALYKSAGFTEYGRNPKAFKSPLSGWQELIMMRLEINKTGV